MVAKILCVDDEELLLSSLKRILENAGFQVSTAFDANEGIELCRITQFDLVLSDQQLPGMSGLEFLEVLREISPQTMRIILSGKTSLPLARKALMQETIMGYIRKPWKNEELITTIEGFLKKS
jgi:putative two-component system response regulator